jgi:hypothetical protein
MKQLLKLKFSEKINITIDSADETYKIGSTHSMDIRKSCQGEFVLKLKLFGFF